MHRRSFASKTFGEAEPEGRASVCATGVCVGLWLTPSPPVFNRRPTQTGLANARPFTACPNKPKAKGALATAVCVCLRLTVSTFATPLPPASQSDTLLLTLKETPTMSTAALTRTELTRRPLVITKP